MFSATNTDFADRTLVAPLLEAFFAHLIGLAHMSEFRNIAGNIPVFISLITLLHTSKTFSLILLSGKIDLVNN